MVAIETTKRDPSNHTISARTLESCVPKKWAQLWMSSEVLAGEEHNMIHHLMVLYDCLSLTTHLREKRMEIDSAALRVFSLVHDTRRENDGVTDHEHATRAFWFSQHLKDYPFSLIRENAPESFTLAQQIILYHNYDLSAPNLPQPLLELLKNPAFLVAVLADRISLSRYNGKIYNKSEWQTTTAHLKSGLPDEFFNLFDVKFLNELLENNYNWHILAEGYRRDGVEQVEAALTSGKNLQILT